MTHDDFEEHIRNLQTQLTVAQQQALAAQQKVWATEGAMQFARHCLSQLAIPEPDTNEIEPYDEQEQDVVD